LSLPRTTSTLTSATLWREDRYVTLPTESNWHVITETCCLPLSYDDIYMETTKAHDISLFFREPRTKEPRERIEARFIRAGALALGLHAPPPLPVHGDRVRDPEPLFTKTTQICPRRDERIPSTMEQAPVQVGQFILGKNLGIGAFGKVRGNTHVSISP